MDSIFEAFFRFMIATLVSVGFMLVFYGGYWANDHNMWYIGLIVAFFLMIFIYRMLG